MIASIVFEVDIYKVRAKKKEYTPKHLRVFAVETTQVWKAPRCTDFGMKLSPRSMTSPGLLLFPRPPARELESDPFASQNRARLCIGFGIDSGRDTPSIGQHCF